MEHMRPAPVGTKAARKPAGSPSATNDTTQLGPSSSSAIRTAASGAWPLPGRSNCLTKRTTTCHTQPPYQADNHTTACRVRPGQARPGRGGQQHAPRSSSTQVSSRNARASSCTPLFSLGWPRHAEATHPLPQWTRAAPSTQERVCAGAHHEALHSRHRRRRRAPTILPTKDDGQRRRGAPRSRMQAFVGCRQAWRPCSTLVPLAPFTPAAQSYTSGKRTDARARSPGQGGR